MASRRPQRERREVNYNEDVLEKTRGALESVEVHVHRGNKDRETSALYGGDDDASSTSDSDFEAGGRVGRKQQKARAKAESGSDSEFERRPQKKRKELPARALPGRSARPANYKDASSEDDDGNAEDDESVSVGAPVEDTADRDMKLSQEDIADIASADIPAEDVAMLEDGSGADDKGVEDAKPATAAPCKLLKRPAHVTDPEPAASGSERPTGSGAASDKEQKLLALSKLSERTREKKNASKTSRLNSTRTAAEAPSKPTARRSTRERSRVNLAEPDSEGDDASLVDDSEFEGGDASSEGDEAMEKEVATLLSDDDDDDFEDDAPRRPAPKNQANGGPVRRSTRAAAPAPAPQERKQEAGKAPVKKGKGKPAGANRKPGLSRSRSGSRKNTPAESEEDEESSEDEHEDGPKKSRFKQEESELERVEKILAVRNYEDGREQFYVKFKETSYRKAKWVPGEELWEVKAQLLRNFMQRRASSGEPSDEDEESGQRGLVNGVHPDWMVVDRVIAQRGKGASLEYLVKWCQLSYSETTWEPARHLSQLEDKEAIAAFKKREQPSPLRKGASAARTDVVPSFLNGRKLRDYQRDSLKWMMANFRIQKNCILGDEMGLGKTAQSIATLAFQRQFLGIAGPHIVIAPLTTLGHWQREIETWTGMNVVQYTGSKADREIIRKHEFHFDTKDRSKKKRYKFDVLLTSYETVLKDSSVFLSIHDWGTMIADEAHRFKSVSGSTRRVVTSMHVQWKLLLTGTPVQNSMEELFGILNVLDPNKYDDEDEFLERFGKGMPTLEQVQDLQAELRPVLLRRMKEDVENLPDKEEVVVWVELTTEQRHFYKAIYGKQIGALLGGATTKNTPQLQNLAMELRKVCCHPFLCRGLEDHMMLRQAARGAGDVPEIDRIVNASGKMVLLAKLLPKLRSEGHKVLIFSQFKIMLDVLEDFLRLGGFPFERIDGSVSQRDREDAINRYSKEGSDGFVFLLSTRAGGQGITLTAADTVIIYDTDFNPQNDLQAMARCHRIGQDKEVKVYRLITTGTYEQNVFECSTRKQGLDNAILGFLNADERKVDGARIAQLLAHGAHVLAAPEEETVKEGEAFASEDIDSILARRTEKRQLGNSKGNTFSTATFSVQEEEANKIADPREYWSAILPEAVASHDAHAAAARVPVDLGKRQRRKVVYNEAELGRARASASESSSSDESEFEGDEAAEDEDGSGSGVSLVTEEGTEGKKRRRRTKEEMRLREWKQTELKALEEQLLLFGEGNTPRIRSLAGLEKRPLDEVALVEAALVRVIKRGAQLPAPPKAAGAEGVSAGAPAIPAQPLLTPEMRIPKFAKKAFEGAVSRLEKHAKKHEVQLRDRAVLNRLAAEADPFKEALALATLVPKATNLPAAWTVTEDARLLLAAQRMGYYPNNARRQTASDGFLAKFMNLYTPVRLDPQVDAQKTGEAAGNGAPLAGAEEKPVLARAPAQAPAPSHAAAPVQAPPTAGVAGASTKPDTAPATAAEKEPVKPSATPKKVYRPPWARTPPASSQKAAEAPAPAAAEALAAATAAMVPNKAPAVGVPNQAVPAAAAAPMNGTQVAQQHTVSYGTWCAFLQVIDMRYSRLIMALHARSNLLRPSPVPLPWLGQPHV
ncbi:Chromodomain-helicase-DNA-binding protein 6 [Coccomyxa sp. Obi]|nr:Chromodomain-helicase-DNA-binding protein 6 [Coccomyxa sp. Obi]